MDNFLAMSLKIGKVVTKGKGMNHVTRKLQSKLLRPIPAQWCRRKEKQSLRSGDGCSAIHPSSFVFFPRILYEVREGGLRWRLQSVIFRENTSTCPIDNRNILKNVGTIRRNVAHEWLLRIVKTGERSWMVSRAMSDTRSCIFVKMVDVFTSRETFVRSIWRSKDKEFEQQLLHKWYEEKKQRSLL